MQPIDNVLLGLGGFKESGKDTFAKFVGCANSEHDVAIINMSGPLQEAILAIDPWIFVPTTWQNLGWGTHVRYSLILDYIDTHSQRFDGDSFTIAKTIPGVREFLQALGTDVVRNIVEEDAWVNIIRRRIHEAFDGGAGIVMVSGIRYPNEIEMIRKLGGTNVWVKRSNNRVDSHSSENSLTEKDFDEVVDNRGTKEQLKEIVARDYKYL